MARREAGWTSDRLQIRKTAGFGEQNLKPGQRSIQTRTCCFVGLATPEEAVLGIVAVRL
jgi:hypothetical protein